MAAVDRRRVVAVGSQCRLFLAIIDSLLKISGSGSIKRGGGGPCLGDTVGKFVPMHSAIIDDR